MKNIQSIILIVATALIVWNCTPRVSQDMKAGQAETVPNITEDWRATAPEPGPPPVFELGTYEDFQLENGLQVIVVENNKLPVVSYQLFVDRGPVKEGDIAGVASITGQMLKSGTKNMTKEEMDEKLDFLAASLNTSSNGFFASSLKKHSDKLLNIATDVLYHPSFPQSEFDRIIQITKSGLTFQQSDPNSILANVGNAIIYGKDHSYGEFSTLESVNTITLDDVNNFYNKYYFPNMAYLIIVGDITTAEARAQAEKYFGSWESDPGFSVMIPADVDQPSSNSVNFVNMDGAVQSVIAVAQPVEFEPDAEDRMAVNVMNTILGGYFGSRLNKNIREDKGYTYGIRSSLDPDRYIGEFSISASTRNNVTDSALTQIFKELENIRQEPVDSAELELVKNVKTGQYARSLESPQTIAQYALNIARYDLPKDYYATYLERLEKITPRDVQQAAMKYLDPQHMNIIIVGNKSEVAKNLLPFDGNNEIEFYNTKGVEIETKPLIETMGDQVSDVSAESIINHYIEAMGGREKLASVESFILISKAATPMGDVTTTIKGKDNTKIHLTVEASGMVVQEIVFNGEKAKVGGVQGSQVITDSTQFDRFRTMTQFAKELDYFTSEDYEVSFVGQETLNGEAAYKLKVVKSDGTTTIEYYNAETGLKLKEVTNVAVNGQQISTTQKFDNYQEVDGIMVPMEMTLSGGGMPFEMVTKVEDIQLNPEIADEVFEIE